MVIGQKFQGNRDIMLLTRIVTALIALPLVATAVYVGGIWFLSGVLLIALISSWEFDRMMKAGGYKTSPGFTLGLTALLVANNYRSDLSLNCILSFFLLASLVWQLFRRDSTAPTADWALTLIGGLYIGWGLGHLVGLRQLANGQAWVWLALISTWSADTMAYLIGRSLGRRKLWPRLSPKKTWEGFIGGIVGGMVGSGVVAYLFELGWINALLLGMIIPVVALFGDLSISMMKRHAGVKDSSQLFPGHGGFLDRADSMLFVSVVVYYYVVWHGLFGLTGL